MPLIYLPIMSLQQKQFHHHHKPNPNAIRLPPPHAHPPHPPVGRLEEMGVSLYLGARPEMVRNNTLRFEGGDESMFNPVLGFLRWGCGVWGADEGTDSVYWAAAEFWHHGVVGSGVYIGVNFEYSSRMYAADWGQAISSRLCSRRRRCDRGTENGSRKHCAGRYCG